MGAPSETHDGSDSSPGVEHESGVAHVELAPGARLGRYLVLAEIGEGGMSLVYSGYDPELDRKVAIKLLQITPDASSQRLEREAHALARLNHPHVVHVYDVGKSGDELYLVQELLEGGTLGDWLAARRRSWREVIEVFGAIGQGLAAAHAAGLVHRDVKPANVLFDGAGRVRLVDFGLVISAGDGTEAGTAAGVGVGTPGYMSPEQRAGGTVDARSDQFAFCATLHEALFGYLPGETPPAAEGHARPARVPAPIRRAILRGLADDPADRFASLEALLAGLAAVLRRLRRRLAAATGVVVIAAAVAAVWALRRDPALCHGGRARVAGVWDARHKQTVRAAFVATGRPYAEQAWSVAAAEVDSWASDFASLHDDACAAVHVRGERSAALLDRQMLCLEEARREMAALVELFARADGTVVDHAVEAAGAAAPLAPCADVGALLALRKPAPPDQSVRVAEVRGQVVAARALQHVGKPAVAQAERAVAAAKELGWAPLEADANLALGDALASDPRAEQAYLEALWAAARAGDDRLSALAAIALVTMSRDAADGDRMAKLAEAMIARGGGDPRLAALRREKVLVRYGRRGERELALPAALVSLVDAVRLGAQPAQLASAHSLLADSWLNLGRLEAAEAHERIAVTLLEDLLGRGHPDVLVAVQALARYVSGQGRHADGIAVLEPTLAAWQALGADGAREHAIVKRQLAGFYFSLGDYERCLAYASEAEAFFAPLGELELDEFAHAVEMKAYGYYGMGRAQDTVAAMTLVVELRVRRFGADAPMVAYGRGNLASALLAAGQPARALEEETAAIPVLEQTYGARHELLMVAHQDRGLALLALGRVAEARGALELARSIGEDLGGPANPMLVSVLTGLGQVAVAERDLPRAASLLERAHTIAATPGVGPFEAGAAALALAQVRWARGDKDAARTLARAARDHLAGTGEKGAALHATAVALASR